MEKAPFPNSNWAGDIGVGEDQVNPWLLQPQSVFTKEMNRGLCGKEWHPGIRTCRRLDLGNLVRPVLPACGFIAREIKG